MSDLVVRAARLDDLSYVADVGWRDRECIGFLPTSRYAALIDGAGPEARPNHRIWLCEVNGDRVGFLYFSPGRYASTAKIIQICVQEDARRLEYGEALVGQAEREATARQRNGVACAVATDIEATQFWNALGYEPQFTYEGGKRRKRILERRLKRLVCGLFIDVPGQRGAAGDAEHTEPLSCTGSGS